MNSFQMTTKVNGMVTLTVTLTLKIANLDFVAVGGIRASQAHPFHLSNALYRFLAGLQSNSGLLCCKVITIYFV